MKKFMLVAFACIWMVGAVVIAYYPRETMAYICSLKWERAVTLKDLNTESEPRKVCASGENNSPYWPTYELESDESVYGTEQSYVVAISINGNRPVDIEVPQTKWESLCKDTTVPVSIIYS